MSDDEIGVEVRPYDARIRASLGTWTPEIVHFGSTAVPGLSAKPIVDILVGVTGATDSTRLAPALDELAYEYLGEDGRRPGRFFWRKRGDESFNVSSVPLHGPLWWSNLAVRDFLRTHDDWASDYAEAKVAAARSSGASLDGYQDAKRDFVDRLRAAALGWYGVR